MRDAPATAPFAQLAVMAAIVATLVYLPLGFGLALVLHFVGIAPRLLVTFGGALSMPLGFAVWWLLFFAGALVYAACLFPWGDKILAWPKRQ